MPWLILGIAGLAGLFFFARRDQREPAAPDQHGRATAPTAPTVDGSTQFKGLTLDHIAKNVATLFEVAKGNLPQAISDVRAGFRQMPDEHRQYVAKKAVELGAPREGIHMALLASLAN